VDRQLAVSPETPWTSATAPWGRARDLFVDGAMVGSATTDESGAYEIKVPYDTAATTTVLLWFVPQGGVSCPRSLSSGIQGEPGERPHLALRPESELPAGASIPRLPLRPATRNKDLAELDCLP